MNKLHLLLSIFMLSLLSATAQVPLISFQPVQTGFSSPVDVVNAGDGSNRLFIVEQTGTIRIYQNGAVVSPAFLDISSIVLTNASERGLLSLAFHPAYSSNRYFFVYYTNLSGEITVARYQTDAGNPNHATASTGVVLMHIPKPFSNHNGGKLNFGKDGNLYFGTGDGGAGGDPNNNAQNGNSLLGKMIRINVDNFTTPPYYTIPANNPYVSDPNVLDEIWALGLRNPWRWSFDKQNANMWIADVGQDLWEEVNFRTNGNTGGINYGWRCYEATHSYNTTGCQPQANYISPIFEYPHNNATGGFAITGGYVYRGSEFPVLQGYYLVADYVSGNGWLIKPDGSGGWTTTQQSWVTGISGFGEAEDTSLYAVGLTGTLFKVNAFNPIKLTLLLFTGKNNNGTANLRWVTENENMASRFEVQQSSDAQNFTVAGSVPAVNIPRTNAYTFNTSPAAIYYRLRMIDITGAFTYSPVIKLSSTKNMGQQIFPNLINTGVLNIYPTDNLTAMNIYNAAGARVFSRQYTSSSLHVQENISTLAKGLYTVTMQGKNSISTEKIIVQ